MKVGTVSIIGLPNAGKSTLLNSLAGMKLARFVVAVAIFVVYAPGDLLKTAGTDSRKSSLQWECGPGESHRGHLEAGRRALCGEQGSG